MTLGVTPRQGSQSATLGHFFGQSKQRDDSFYSSSDGELSSCDESLEPAPITPKNFRSHSLRQGVRHVHMPSHRRSFHKSNDSLDAGGSYHSRVSIQEYRKRRDQGLDSSSCHSRMSLDDFHQQRQQQQPPNRREQRSSSMSLDGTSSSSTHSTRSIDEIRARRLQQKQPLERLSASEHSSLRNSTGRISSSLDSTSSSSSSHHRMRHRSVRGGRRYEVRSMVQERTTTPVHLQPKPPREEPTNNEAAQIEVAPGVMARLRGIKEAYEYVKTDSFLPTTCAVCLTDLYSVMDASFVLCPMCRVVGPLEGGTPNGKGGVGIGFTHEVLKQWQNEIARQRE